MACLRKTLLLLLTVLVLVKSQECPPPSQSQISSSLTMALIASGGESSTITVDLQDYHFTCLAVESSDSYRSLSVVVQYTVIDMGSTSAVQYAQFQLECATGSPNFYQLPSTTPFDGSVSSSSLSATTRRDCRFCTGAPTGPAGLDTTANCFVCSSTCLSMGQGACAADGTTCCPFFNTDGSCTTACPTNYAASSATNYTCACAFPCPLGHEPNTTCNGCVSVHICVTSNPCQNGATCVIGSNSNTNYTCSCPSNYGGDNCTDCVLSCSPGEEANSGCTMCDPVHICLTSNPCQNGATCNIGAGNTDYTCSCPPNYSGQTCDQCVLSCPLGQEANSACECVPVHTCLTNNPCQNGATCNIGANSNTDYTCSCPPDYTGQNCDISAQCVLPCPLGFEPNSACTGCVPVHICLTSNPCQNGAACNIGTNSNTNYTCSCPANFTGQNCEICDLPCPMAGYEPISTCTGECVPVHICVTSNPCQNGATCSIGTNSNTNYTCSCVSPFTDKNCSTRGSPCSPNPCQNGGRCSSDGEEYSCTCVNSWRGADCTGCGVMNCAMCSQSRLGCDMCNIGYNSEDNLQCTSITPTIILTWWQWLLIALGIVFFIFFFILVPVLMVWRCCKYRKEHDKPEVEKDKEKDKEKVKLENTYV